MKSVYMIELYWSIVWVINYKHLFLNEVTIKICRDFSIKINKIEVKMYTTNIQNTNIKHSNQLKLIKKLYKGGAENKILLT